MERERDLCWLKKAVRQGFQTFCMDGIEGCAQKETVQREMPQLFEGIAETEQVDADICFRLTEDADLAEEGYRIVEKDQRYEVEASAVQGLLYGMFGLHRILLAEHRPVFPYTSVPDQSIRMINHWDNFDGSIERGYAGESIYYENNQFRGDLELIRQYARLLCSAGINAISINNVNVHGLETHFVEPEYLQEIKKIADVFEEYGIRLFLSINYASPMSIGGLDTADPLAPEVAGWWRETIAKIYEIIPQFAGFVVKADSEGRPGPFTYGRNHDE